MNDGDKVVCINDTPYPWSQEHLFNRWIKKDEIYCVRKYLSHDALYLVGIIGPNINYRYGEQPLDPSRFVRIWSQENFKTITTANHE